MTDYTDNDPRGWCGDPSRGAAMGRPTIHTEDTATAHKLTLQRVRLDAGGYDPLGTYFGSGTPLYWYASACGAIDGMLRASTRKEAKAHIRTQYPHARFYN